MFKRVKSFLNLKSDLVYSILFKFLQQLGGLLVLFFVARFLSPEEQGFYYTFASIVAIQVFFELGLSNVIVQFVAHENANIIWNDKSQINSKNPNVSRLSSLLSFTIKSFFLISILLLIFLGFAGFIFFSKFESPNDTINWQSPWLVIVLNASASLFFNAIMSFLEGMDRIASVSRIRSIQQTLIIILSIALFNFGFKLFSVPTAMILSLCITSIYFLRSKEFELIKKVLENSGLVKVEYFKEIFPLQWKIAISWMSGYLIFQLINPLLFAIEGPVVAGKMGITMAVLNAIMGLGFVWITIKIPRFSFLIVQRKFKDLNREYYSALLKSCVVILIGMFSFVYFIKIIDDYELLSFEVEKKFVSSILIFKLIIIVFLNFIVGTIGVYVRCHKREPLFVQSVVMSVFSALAFYYFTDLFGVVGLINANVFLTIFGFIWVMHIFSKFKRKWHEG